MLISDQFFLRLLARHFHPPTHDDLKEKINISTRIRYSILLTTLLAICSDFIGFHELKNKHFYEISMVTHGEDFLSRYP